MLSTFRIPAALAVLAIFLTGCSPSSGGQTSGIGPTTTPVPETSAPPAPSATQTTRVPSPPLEFTGRIDCGPPVRHGREETLDVGEDGTVLTRSRNGAWVQDVDMSDPRLEGAIHHTYESDSYRPAGTDDGPQVSGYAWRIVNDGGSWESRTTAATFADGTSVGDPPAVFVGAGGYEGLIAIFEVTAEHPPCDIEVRGIIFDGAPLPEPYTAG